MTEKIKYVGNLVREKVEKNKKKIKKTIITVLAIMIVGGSTLAFAGYKYITSNINYDKAAATEIALEKVPGEILWVTKDIEHGILEYEFKIRTEENTIAEITVDSKYGAIVDYEGVRNIFKK